MGQALADVASLALVAKAGSADRETVDRQLRNALDSRVVLEQAKGVLAHIGNLDMDQSFALLRRYARDHRDLLSDVAGRIVTQELPGETVLAHARTESVEVSLTSPGRTSS